jgi:4-amino-4-deoxy-L-arabinose transferase-like glycosyltransferase
MTNIKNFILKHYSVILIIFILLVAAITRFWHIDGYLVFLGDEGRDALVVRDILHGHLTFLGPRASAGDFYTGPIYYYMMAPFLLLANYNPVGPAIMIALLSIATTFMIYKFGKEWIGEIGALAASALYAVSPLVIQYSRSSWNPNPMPFFSMLIFYLLYKAVKKSTVPLFFVIGVLYGLAFQLHYIEVIVGVVIAFFVLVGNIILKNKKLVLKVLGQYANLAVGFIVGFSPFLIFEIRHGFPNIRTIIYFVIHGDPGATDNTHLTFFQIIPDVYFRLFGRLVVNYPPIEQLKLFDKNLLELWGIAVIIVAIVSTISIIVMKEKLAKLLFFLWLFFGVILFGFYHKPIYDYYFEFMFPLPFMLVGNLINIAWEKKKMIRLAGFLLFAALLMVNLKGDPLSKNPNYQFNQVKMISEFILKQAGGKPFNFALITGGNSDHAYRYIFAIENHPETTILNSQVDPGRKSVTDQLFVVCEQIPCHPEGASLWEVAGFGRAKIVKEWPVSVLKVYKLEHYSGK